MYNSSVLFAGGWFGLVSFVSAELGIKASVFTLSYIPSPSYKMIETSSHCFQVVWAQLELAIFLLPRVLRLQPCNAMPRCVALNSEKTGMI